MSVSLVHLSALLAGPGPSGSADPSRRCQGRLPPSPAPSGSGCPQLHQAAATAWRRSPFISARIPWRLVAHAAVDVDLALVRDPALDPDVHEPELVIDQIQVVVQAPALTAEHLDPSALIAFADLERHARLDRTDQTNDPCGDPFAFGVKSFSGTLRIPEVFVQPFRSIPYSHSGGFRTSP